MVNMEEIDNSKTEIFMHIQANTHTVYTHTHTLVYNVHCFLPIYFSLLCFGHHSIFVFLKNSSISLISI